MVIIFAVVLLGSTLRVLEINYGSTTPLANKRNPFNQIFVKWSWAWTLVCVIPTVLLTSALYTGLNKWAMLRHMSRVGVAHTIWYLMTSLFERIDRMSGECSDSSVTTPRACIKQGHDWLGFDISGHVFLLTYCILILTEEMAGIKMEVWQEYNGTLLEQKRVVSKLSKQVIQLLPELHRFTTLAVSLLEFLATAEMLLWSFMLCTTSLYFHNFIEKLLGAIIGCGMWFITYRLLYGSSRWAPLGPGEGLLHPVTQLNVNSEE